LPRAVLLVGRDGAFRRSEVTGLDLEHLTPIESGYAVLIPKSKTDQEGEGLVSALARIEGPYCPVVALDAWLDVRGRLPGAIFRSVSKGGAILPNRLPARKVADIVQRLTKKAGLQLDVSGHSLRAGFITQAIENGVPVEAIQLQTHHTDFKALKEYIRRRDPMTGNAVATLHKKARDK
jgi:integrase